MKVVPDPYIQAERSALYHPLTGERLAPGEPGADLLSALLRGEDRIEEADPGIVAKLVDGGWLMEPVQDPECRYHLRYVSLEGHSSCNQGCYFCPVSVAPRARYEMGMDLYASIADQLSDFRATLKAVFMHNYNEPTADKRFVEQVRVLKGAELPVAFNTNATGLTPDRVDAVCALGGAEYISINLSTLDEARYAKDRRSSTLTLVLRNLDYLAEHPVAPRMDLAVLGPGDATHDADWSDMQARFGNTPFNLVRFTTNDRSGYLDNGLKPGEPHRALGGCQQMGSRVVEHLHITASGQCVLCCQDYGEKHVLGDLNCESVKEVLEGEPFKQYRRWVYGMEPVPENFICSRCVFAVPK